MINIGWPSIKSMSQMYSYAGITLCLANVKTLFSVYGTSAQVANTQCCRSITFVICILYILVWFHSNIPPTLTITHSNYFCCHSESSGAYASFIRGVDSILNQGWGGGIICPPGLNRVNWSAKFRGWGRALAPGPPPSSYTSVYTVLHCCSLIYAITKLLFMPAILLSPSKVKNF